MVRIVRRWIPARHQRRDVETRERKAERGKREEVKERETVKTSDRLETLVSTRLLQIRDRRSVHDKESYKEL